MYTLYDFLVAISLKSSSLERESEMKRLSIPARRQYTCKHISSFQLTQHYNLPLYSEFSYCLYTWDLAERDLQVLFINMFYFTIDVVSDITFNLIVKGSTYLPASVN